ncbi:hypothetical protein BS17DRAFT_798591 [Gyrodon lividus]|nr:hypothetical protein BS17DRAFT_576018 [Gyrodon lividus]KAF9218424.1 hypothetical protein BS17DRAFT_798591 [Gyrodon lividus]
MSSQVTPSSTPSAFPSNPTTPAYSDELEWITAYLTIHSLSAPSRRYSFLLWLAVVLIFLIFAVLHWTGSRGGFFGAYWTRWSIRRRTWRKKHTLAVAHRTNQPHRQPRSLPSNAQLLSLSILMLACLALAFVGPDYLAPHLKVWHIRARDLSLSTSTRPHQLYDSSTFEPYVPQYTISKSFWSSSARTGQIAFALFPLCVLFALKAPPFAIFAIPFMIQLYFDKLAWLHRWSGRLIWFLTSIHVVLWSIQLTRDLNPSTGRVAYVYAWTYTPFIYGWIVGRPFLFSFRVLIPFQAFVLLTLLILLSMHPIRRKFYEAFYFMHVLLVPLMLITAALHHPTVWWWCWAALAVWAGERLWRGTWWIYTNGFIGGMSPKTLPPPSHSKTASRDTWEMDHFSIETASLHFPLDSSSIRSPSPLSPYYLNDKSPISSGRLTSASASRPSPAFIFPSERDLSGSTRSRVLPPYLPPPGYAHAELLSGRTIRLRLITPGFLPWAPGQHFLVNIPSVSRLTSHPFTCTSVCDDESPTDEGRMMMFLVRAKNGWTQDLWDLVTQMTAERFPGDVPATFGPASLPKRGVLLRAYVDGPFGSSKRARWGNYSTGVIIAGGSGVSFGLSLLQYMCLCLAGRDGRHLGGRPGGWGRKGVDMKRVRFIWLIREYSHVQWCASIIRRCISMVPSSALQVDIYVTNFKPILMRPPALPPLSIPTQTRFDPDPTITGEELQPPHPRFTRDNVARFRSDSTGSVESNESHASDVDLSYYMGEYPVDPPVDDMNVAHQTNILDLTNFDGDDDTALPGEANLTRKVKKEGKIRRSQSRKFGKVAEMMGNDDARAVHILTHSLGQTHAHAQAMAHVHPPPLASFHPRRTLRLSALSAQSTDRLLPISPLSERPTSATSEMDGYSPLSLFSPYADSPTRPKLPPGSEPPVIDLTPTVSLVTPPIACSEPGSPTRSSQSYSDGKSEALSSRTVMTWQIPMTKTMNVHNASLASASSNPQIRFEIDEQEARDINVISEHARPGKPKLDKVIADEVEGSKGAVVVACCGPTSLNAMVRKIIAAQIDPARIWRGDMRGCIALVSEEFEY